MKTALVLHQHIGMRDNISKILKHVGIKTTCDDDKGYDNYDIIITDSRSEKSLNGTRTPVLVTTQNESKDDNGRVYIHQPFSIDDFSNKVINLLRSKNVQA